MKPNDSTNVPAPAPRPTNGLAQLAGRGHNQAPPRSRASPPTLDHPSSPRSPRGPHAASRKDKAHGVSAWIQGPIPSNRPDSRRILATTHRCCNSGHSDPVLSAPRTVWPTSPLRHCAPCTHGRRTYGRHNPNNSSTAGHPRGPPDGLAGIMHDIISTLERVQRFPPRQGPMGRDREHPRALPRGLEQQHGAMTYGCLIYGMGAGFPAPRRGRGMTAVISSVSPAPCVEYTVRTCRVRTEPCSNDSGTGTTLELAKGPHVASTEHPRGATLDDNRRGCPNNYGSPQGRRQDGRHSLERRRAL